MAMVPQPQQEQIVPYEYGNDGYANTNMAMVAQPAQEQIVPEGYEYGYGYVPEYEYDGYQYAYPQQYPHAGHYPYVPPPPQVPTVTLNIVVNINPNGHTNNQGHNNNHYGHPGSNQFQPATPQQQRHSYHQQLRQPQPPRFEIMQGQRSQSGSGPVVFQDDYNLPGFITRYANAKFFVIKTDNKEHVLSSIRHGVWTSTSGEIEN
jgi:hypothetical protein